MAAIDDILATWRGPRRAQRQMLAGPREEGRALAYLIAALILVFIALWPGMAREGALAAQNAAGQTAAGQGAAVPEVPMTQRMLGAALAVLATIPVFYGLAALGHLAARAFGGRGSWLGARLALFWALLAAAPGILLQGLIAGMIGPGAGLTLAGLLVFAAFLWFWIAGLMEAEFGGGGT